MKSNILNIALLIIALFTIQTVEANSIYAAPDTSDANMIFGSARVATKVQVSTGAFGEVVADVKSADAFFDVADKRNANSPEYVRQAKMQEADYTGYKIELMTVYNQKLSASDELFQNFGGITIISRTENSYTYLLGDFQDKDAFDKYLETIVQPRYTDAKGIKFKNGEEVKFK